ncbi:terminase small subunit [Escherichia coli]|nr:terminase small subunit [Escherichia coli]
MEVNKKQLADIFGASIRTIQNWQEQGMPVLRGGGKGNEVLYDSAAVIRWYAERDAEIENEKLRREVEELRQASETDLQPGTIEYERHRLTRAQADAQELKNARDSAEVVETAFCTFVLSRIAGEIASILDGIPLSVQRRFPELENRHVDFLKRDIIKAMNKAAALDELILHRQIFRLASWLFSTVMSHRGISLKIIGVKRFMTWLPATRYLFLNSVRYRKMLPGYRRKGSFRSGTAQPG